MELDERCKEGYDAGCTVTPSVGWCEYGKETWKGVGLLDEAFGFRGPRGPITSLWILHGDKPAGRLHDGFEVRRYYILWEM